MIALRRFTEAGIARFAEVLDELREGKNPDVAALVADESLAERLSEDDVVDVVPFENRRAAAEHMDQLLLPFESQLGDVERDRGLWAWLAAAWIDIIASKDDSGRRKIGASARWIPVTDDYRKYYRHLLAGPFRIYRAHRDNPDRAMAVLATEVGSPGEVVEQLASRQEIVTNRNLLDAITELYYDAESGSLKRGAAGKDAGGARRLAGDILVQLDLTWDIYGMDSGEILALLPDEFDRFREAS